MGTSKLIDPRPIARRLHAEEGLSTRRIGEIMGVSAMTAWRWIDPEHARADRERVRAARARRREAVAEAPGETR